MKISVIGCGYLGAVHAASMASLGHEVIGIDVIPETVDALNSGFASIYEPGLDDLLQLGIESGKLRFTTDFSEAKAAVAHFIGVGTPQKQDGSGADLSFLHSAVNKLLPYIDENDVVIGKSTVPVGTAEMLAESEEFVASGAVLAWNPEFLREGHAINDTVAPDRLVYGLPNDTVQAEQARTVLDEIYSLILGRGTPRIATNYSTAELVKVSANAFLATKISFINAVSQVADKTGANITELAEAIGLDDRIGRKFLNAGVGFGGGCLPKDIRAFSARADELGVEYIAQLMSVVDSINLYQRRNIVNLVQKFFPNPQGIKVGILGLAFKSNSDDLRDSPALDVARILQKTGYDVVATDPKAAKKAAEIVPEITYVDTFEEALDSVDIAVLLTEWKHFTTAMPPNAPKPGTVIIDGRNALDSNKWKKSGWAYHGIGRR